MIYGAVVMTKPNRKLHSIAHQRCLYDALVAKDICRIGELAIKCDGLLNNSIRRDAWPLLLQLNAVSLTETTIDLDAEVKRQIDVDVARSFVHFPKNLSVSERSQLRKQLTEILYCVSNSVVDSHYYQGFHDVCTVLLLVLHDFDMVKKAAISIAKNYLYYAMRDTMVPVQQDLEHLYPLLREIDPEIYVVLAQQETPMYFALSWFITWFSHDLDDFFSVARLFDVFISMNDRLAPLYLAVALLHLKRQEILKQEELHTYLCQLPQQAIQDDKDHSFLEKWIRLALHLYHSHPPTLVRKLHTVPRTLQRKPWYTSMTRPKMLLITAGLGIATAIFMFRHKNYFSYR